MNVKNYKLYGLLIFIVFLVSGCGIISKYKITDKGNQIEIQSPLPSLNIGEKFTYKAEWLGLDVGITTLSIEDIVEQNGRKAYRIVATAETTPVLSKIYKVKDRIITYLDVEKLYPLRFEKIQREGGYRSNEYTDFDQKKGKAVTYSRLNGSKKEFDIPKNVQDPLSSLYYLRLQDVNSTKSIFADVNIDEKNYLLEAKIRRKGFLKIKGVGGWEAFMVEPLPWFQGKVTRKVKATIWFSADEKRVPLLITTSGIPLVGSITITLQKIENLDTSSQ